MLLINYTSIRLYIKHNFIYDSDGYEADLFVYPPWLQVLEVYLEKVFVNNN